MRFRRFAVALAGLLGSAVFAVLAVRHLDAAAVLAAWHSARTFPWVPLAVIAYLAGHFVRGQRLRVLVRRETILPLTTATNVVVVGYASNNVFPARLGELVRAGTLTERTGLPLSQSLTITFIERLLDGIAILLLLVVAAASLGTRADWIWDVARVGTLVFGAATMVVLVAVFAPNLVLAAAFRLSARMSSRWRNRVLGLASSITTAGAVLKRPRDAMLLGVYSVVVWLFESAMFLAILPVFSLPASPAVAMAAMSVTNLGLLAPSSPGFVGSFHLFCSQTLISQGVAAATAMSYAILVHLAFYVPVTLWGAGVILFYGIQVGATAAMARAGKGSPKTETIAGVPVHVIAQLAPVAQAPAASPFDVALAEALLKEGTSDLDRTALQQAATFLAGEMSALPARLRFMFEMGMASFRVYVRIRYLRSFCALDVARRRAAVDAWAFGRVGLFRQLFRPVRSVTLLAYYEGAGAAAARSVAAPRLVSAPLGLGTDA